MAQLVRPRTTQIRRHRLHHSGLRPLRVLAIGDRDQVLAVADGATLARRVLDRLWLTTRRGVDLDVLVDLAPVLQRAAAAADDWRLWRYDAVVVVDDGTSPRRRERVLQQVAGLLRADAAHGTPVVLVTEAPRRRVETADERRLRDEAVTASTGALRLSEVPSAARDLAGAREWAGAIGRAVAAAVLESPDAGDGREDEAGRQQALDDSGIVGSSPSDRLVGLVELARSAFGTDGAAVNFLDRDRQWKLAVAGDERMGDDRAQAFCGRTIERAEPFVVGDTRRDPRTESSVLARGPHAVRFYAAHPIESEDGYRIGTLCVYDSEPRDVRGLDLAVLRDLALLAQAELVPQDSVPVGVGPVLRMGSPA